MEIYTSYFGLVKNLNPERLVSVAGKSPDGFSGLEYRKLCPKWTWWKEWHDKGLSEEWYTQKYNATVLKFLDAKEVLKEIGDNKILLCWETPQKFCHRHLIADWIEKNTGVKVKELSTEKCLEFLAKDINNFPSVGSEKGKGKVKINGRDFNKIVMDYSKNRVK